MGHPFVYDAIQFSAFYSECEKRNSVAGGALQDEENLCDVISYIRWKMLERHVQSLSLVDSYGFYSADLLQELSS